MLGLLMGGTNELAVLMGSGAMIGSGIQKLIREHIIYLDMQTCACGKNNS
jgi:hypothetical protein